MARHKIHIGTAAWAVPCEQAGAFPAEGSQLERYAARMNCVEINSSFYRSHRPQTYERWAASTPEDFRFAVKLPRQITHELRLVGVAKLLEGFAGQAHGLGTKWAVLLMQLPPTLHFDATVATPFFKQLHALFDGCVVCEPRHASWFTPEAEQCMGLSRIARAAVDPAKWSSASEPGGWTGGVNYFRWHGSPRLYWSAYDEPWLQQRAKALPSGRDCWCIFDNTASGAALGNALQLSMML